MLLRRMCVRPSAAFVVFRLRQDCGGRGVQSFQLTLFNSVWQESDDCERQAQWPAETRGEQAETHYLPAARLERLRDPQARPHHSSPGKLLRTLANRAH
jgi:hypothetical protein